MAINSTFRNGVRSGFNLSPQLSNIKFSQPYRKKIIVKLSDDCIELHCIENDLDAHVIEIHMEK